MHSLHISPNILINLKITLLQHSVFFLRPFMFMCRQLNYPRFRSVAKTSGPCGSDTIAIPVGSSDIPSFISVFVVFIFIKDCWILFRLTNSAYCFYRDTITRRVAVLGSERPIYPHGRMFIPRQIPNLKYIALSSWCNVFI